MRKIFSLHIVLFAVTGLCAQNTVQVANLASFAKVWGFLKYYHSQVAKGNPNWDNELLQKIPEIQALSNQASYDKMMLEWYASLPKPALSNTITQKKSDSIERVFTESEIQFFGIPKTLQWKLVQLYRYHMPDSNIYYSNAYQGHELDYIYHIENPYTEPSFPDEPHRLLALFRYWNIINYFYPHRNVNAPNWNKVLTRFIPLFIADRNTNEYRQTFLLLTAQIKDSHSFFVQEEWNKEHDQLNLPFTTYYINGRYYIGRSRYDSLMKINEFRVGDEVIAINGQVIKKREQELRPFTTGTNELSLHRNIANRLFKIDTNRVLQLSVKRNGSIRTKTANLYSEMELYQYRQRHAEKLWEDRGHGIWYVNVCEIKNADTLTRLFTDLQNARAVIWDLRSYPNFQVMQEIGGGLFEKTPASTISSNARLFYPGSFRQHLQTSYTVNHTMHLPLYKGKLIVLVNEQTQSLAESVAYELRFRAHTIVIGRQTAGTTGNITFVDYPGGIQASFTGVGVRGLNGSFTEGKGVKIDREIKLTGKNLLQYPDYELQMAYNEALK